MKLCFTLLFLAFASATVLADIQDPPANDYGPTRKLGRGLANLLTAGTEVPNSMCLINEREDNSAAATYGVVKGFGRMFFRMGAGLYEIVTFPFPTYKASYRQFYRSNVPWIHGGYEEFPPELGFQTRYRYSRTSPLY
jgi:putative exosortase-associated protein (TIGR04073 family)